MATDIQSVIHGYDRQKEEQQARLTAEENNLPYINLVNYPFTGDVLAIIPEGIARQYQIIAFLRLGNTVRVATFKPFSKGLADEMNRIGHKQNITFEPYFSSETSINYGLKQYPVLVRELIDNKARAESESIAAFTKSLSKIEDLGGIVKNVSTTKLFDIILSGALAFDATDIHFEPESNNVRVRFRINGELRDVLEIDNQGYHLLLSRVKNLSHLRLNHLATPQDGRFSIELNKNSTVDIRVNILPATYGETIVLRLLTGKGFMTLEKLGLNKNTEEAIKRNITKPTGMIVITGPTGSGKTTTLYAVLGMLNTQERKIITIEDPVEYRINGVEQIQVDPSHGFDFSQALRAVLRQDPNVVLVGEIRDKETADIAINASLTGHLVLTTLHTNSAAASFARLIEMGTSPNLLADAITLIVAQRLVKRSPNFKQTSNDSGFGLGRTVISEFLEPDNDFGNLIKEKASISQFEKLYTEKGYQTLDQDLQIKKTSGEVDPQESY